jgi:pimeloyl-ACP methyl ester carboxylesterase
MLNASITSTETFQYSKVGNQVVDVGSVRYAYRKVGEDTGVPLILLIHIRDNMDNWDPALVDDLAEQRLVVAFDNKGVGLTNGKTPQSFEEMADDAAAFVRALGYQKVDILAFSIGGAIGQELVLRHPRLVRKAILAGTSGKGGEGVNTMSERSKSVSTKDALTDQDFLYAFFSPSPTSQALGRQFLARIKTRKTDRGVAVSMETVKAQAIARERWGNPFEGYDDLLKKVTTSVLVANGKDDIRMPTVNSYHCFRLFPRPSSFFIRILDMDFCFNTRNRALRTSMTF